MSKKKKAAVVIAKVAPPKRSSNWKLIAGTAALIALSVAGYWYFSHRAPVASKAEQAPVVLTAEGTLDLLIKKDFHGAEKPVADKLRKLVADVKENPSSAHSWGKLAMNLDVHNYKDEALVCYKKASDLAPDDFRWPYYEATLLRERKSDEALTFFQKSLILKQTNWAGHIRYGQALLDAKRYEEAGREFVKALDMNPNSSHAYVGLARIALDQNQVRDSGSLLKKAIEINPRQGEAYALFSEVFTRLNEPQKAKEQLYISKQLPPTTPLQDELVADLMGEGVSSSFHHMRGRVWLNRGDFKNAEQEFQLAINALPDTRYYDALGVAYLYEKKYGEAIAAHRKAIELNPKSAPSMNNLATALFESGKKEEAIRVLNEAIQTDPSLAYSYLHLARLNIQSGNPGVAVQIYRQGLKNIPGDPELSLQFGWLLSTSSDPSVRNGNEALRIVEPVAEKISNPQTLDVLAVAYAEAGHFDRAIAAVQQALSLVQNKQLADSLKAHLKLFQAKHPYHESL